LVSVVFEAKMSVSLDSTIDPIVRRARERLLLVSVGSINVDSKHVLDNAHRSRHRSETVPTWLDEFVHSAVDLRVAEYLGHRMPRNHHFPPSALSNLKH